MAIIDWLKRLKVLIALRDSQEMASLEANLIALGHLVQIRVHLEQILRLLRDWQPDLVITEETFDGGHPGSGLRLAESCRMTDDRINGWSGTRVLIFIPISDWNRFMLAQR